MKSKYLSLLLVGLSIAVARAAIISVPANYLTIQAALDASVNGDTIVVSSGTYFENINFRGRKVLLTSMYYLARDTTYISTTIINGSMPVHPDTASCVIFNSGEDTTSILQGFTITGGAGTKWADIHGAGTFREGGGILIELSSPRIIHNVIINNAATNITGVSGAGGGGIRIGDGNPVICSNAIISNQGRYGAGVVLNYTGCVITNNIIVSNSGGQNYYGGSGIWIYNNLGTTPKIIYNNTIVNNYSSLSAASGTGGVSIWSATNVFMENNIIYGNMPSTQIKAVSATPSVTYSDIEGGYTGTGNINTDPLFESQGYYLSINSPCIDAGDTAGVFNDIEDAGNPGNALFPSGGSLLNDMGAYGGPCAALLPFIETSVGISELTGEIGNILVFPNPVTESSVLQLNLNNSERVKIEVVNVLGETIYTLDNSFRNQGKHIIPLDKINVPCGLYFLKVSASNGFHKAVQFSIVE